LTLPRRTLLPAFHVLEIAPSLVIRTRHRDHLASGKVDKRADMVDGAMPKQTGKESERVRREDLVDEGRLALKRLDG